MILTVVISFLLLCGTGSQAQSCSLPLSRLTDTIVGAFGTDYNVSINCMSFASNGTLYKAIASGFSDSNPNVRFVFSCVGGVIIGVQSNESVSTVENGTCVHCEDTSQPCITSCPDMCERCYIRNTESTPRCSVCTACTARRESSCTPAALMDTQPCELSCDTSLHYKRLESNNWCECKRLELHDYPDMGPDEAHPEEPDIDIEGGADCVTECSRENYRPTDHSREGNICFACGIEYCVTCNATDHCKSCLYGSELYKEENECVTGELAKVVRFAEEQSEEVREERAANERTQITLAIALPIACVAVILFFTFMAIFAHFRYPHISIHGEKRHRQKPEMSPPPEHENVWRSRPTIRLR